MRLSPAARRVTAWLTVGLLAGLAMTGIVFADNNKWAASGVTFVGFGVVLYMLGTAAYRVTTRGARQVEVHSMLGLRRLDLGDGWVVRQAIYGPAVVVVRVGRRRTRLNGGLGRAAAVDSFLRSVATP
ncbi:MAG TPA: hypothetical protein VHD87_02160 [Acidimicrobiales bacterium]|nr:hypothetical protein [Acidimicrobiales bacterium]